MICISLLLVFTLLFCFHFLLLILIYVLKVNCSSIRDINLQDLLSGIVKREEQVYNLYGEW